MPANRRQVGFKGVEFERPAGRGPKRGEHFTVRFREPGGAWQSMFVGRFNVFVPHLDGRFGLKFLKNLYSKVPDRDQVATIVSIHRLLAEQGLGPETRDDVVEVSFAECPGFERIRPLLHWDCHREFDTFRGFWTETLTPKGVLANRIFKPMNLWLRSLPERAWFDTFRRLGCTGIVRNSMVLKLYSRLLYKPLEEKLTRAVCTHGLKHRKGLTTVRELMDNALFDGRSWKVYDIDKNFHLGFGNTAPQPTGEGVPQWSLNPNLLPEKGSVLGLGLDSCGPLLTITGWSLTMAHAAWPNVERLILESKTAGHQNPSVFLVHYDDPWFLRMISGLSGKSHFDRLVIGDVWNDTVCRTRLARDILDLTAPDGVILFQSEAELDHWKLLLNRAAGTSHAPELHHLA